MPEFKRPSGPNMAVALAEEGAPEAKRSKMLVESKAQGPRRTSNLQAPIMLLQGHGGEIYTARFASEGGFLASSGFDMKIFLWNVYGECENFSVIPGHTGAVMQLAFTPDSESLVSCSTDRTVRMWDMHTGGCQRRFKGHNTFVNACDVARRGPKLICSGSDDGTTKVWDARTRGAVHSLQCIYQVTAVCFNDTAEQVMSGGIDNEVKVWDLRKPDTEAYRLEGHVDTVTGLAVSPDGAYLLSNSMDLTARMWDIRPFAPAQRCLKVFAGHAHNFEKNLLRCCWSPDGEKVSAGSADRYVYVWDVQTRKVLYKLPGHQGSVNQTDFHPREPIVMSAGSDKKIYLGEIL